MVMVGDKSGGAQGCGYLFIIGHPIKTIDSAKLSGPATTEDAHVQMAHWVLPE